MSNLHRSLLCCMVGASAAVLPVATAQPVNDLCDNAIALTDGEFNISTIGATTDGPATCGEIGSDVWFLVDAPFGGSTSITICATDGDFDPVITAYSSSACPGRLLHCSADSGLEPATCQSSSATIRLHRWGTNLIQVGGVDGLSGDGVLVIRSCNGDLDGDGEIALGDLAILLSNFGHPTCAAPWPGDLDGDGDIDLSDLAVMLGLFGSFCP